MRLLSFLFVALGLLALSACDLVEVVPPDEPPPVEPPPAQPVHPYGAGNGKVVFLSDLASAQRIDVTLAGEPIGTVTKFVGCPSRVVVDDSLATAIRPAGRYQYSARGADGSTWNQAAITVDEDEATRIVLIGRPRQYAIHLPDEIEGFPVSGPGGLDIFNNRVESPADFRLKVARPSVVQGDRIDVFSNGVAVARNVLLGTADLWFDIPLSPGPNYVAVRLSEDSDGGGFVTNAQFYDGDTFLSGLFAVGARLTTARWSGVNVRNAC